MPSGTGLLANPNSGDTAAKSVVSSFSHSTLPVAASSADTCPVYPTAITRPSITHGVDCGPLFPPFTGVSPFGSLSAAYLCSHNGLPSFGSKAITRSVPFVGSSLSRRPSIVKSRVPSPTTLDSPRPMGTRHATALSVSVPASLAGVRKSPVGPPKEFHAGGSAAKKVVGRNRSSARRDIGHRWERVWITSPAELGGRG